MTTTKNKRSKICISEQELLKDFISVINHAPNIDDMLKDERFDLALMYQFYVQWMNKHHPNVHKIKRVHFLDEFALCV
jgi:hypothetical protein